MCGQRRSGCGILVWREVGERVFEESGGHAWSEQLRGARLEVELEGELELGDERLGEGGGGQGGLNHQMGVHGCLRGWKGKPGSSGLRRVEMCNGCVEETR